MCIPYPSFAQHLSQRRETNRTFACFLHDILSALKRAMAPSFTFISWLGFTGLMYGKCSVNVQ